MLQQHYCSLVLIDTWWNVNFPRLIDVFNDKKVLIDTWWNVNKRIEEMVYAVTGFNRYMVECKYIPGPSLHFPKYSFNRYMVECKFCSQFSMR